MTTTGEKERIYGSGADILEPISPSEANDNLVAFHKVLVTLRDKYHIVNLVCAVQFSVCYPDDAAGLSGALCCGNVEDDITLSTWLTSLLQAEREATIAKLLPPKKETIHGR